VRVPDALGFAGFRVHAPINRPGEFDEFCVFLGASYFRAVGRGQSYGLSARGLAIGTGTPRPEEFPRFRTFWLERPQPRGNTLVIHALLDSHSTTGAFRFTVRPGDTTVMDVESIVFPRIAIQEIGVAPLTSMYYFSGRDHARPDAVRPDDWRAAVHDSDGLGVATGRSERLWRPLINPAAVQFSAFMDANPRGFGLTQRKRAFNDFGDLQVLYGRRPSLWVEPIGDWGVGAVDLVEIPTNSEYHDNIVAFWRGTEPLRAGGRGVQLHLPHALGCGCPTGCEVGAGRGPAHRRGHRARHAGVCARPGRRRRRSLGKRRQNLGGAGQQRRTRG
jgi:glucans biosynthesis protein